ncbi:MAG: tripartite tricarboxylate transporter TctB family protein [Deltaproteobacteria bacterium]|nr:tripartite tricarboxylate transporter TctB family protein [Deltaproteobacteria bacterium]
MLSTPKRNGEIGVACGLLAVSLFLVFTAYRMPLGTGVMPGPGVMPLAIGLVLGVTATLLLFAVLKRPRKHADVVELGSRHILAAVLGLVWVSLLFEDLGFCLCLGVFLLALSREFSRQGWLKPLAFAVLGVAGAYWFFVYLLDVSMPRGLL